LALAPISALFIARISRGRTIRELAFGVIFYGTLGIFILMGILGGYTLYLQKTGLMDVAKVLADTNPGSTAATVMFTLPWQNLMVPLYAILALVFLATTLDSSAYALAAMCTKQVSGYEQPTRSFRFVWAVIIGGFAIGILVTAGAEPLRTIQSSAVVLGLPTIIIWFICLISVIKYVRQDFKDRLVPKLEYKEEKQAF
ncbi:MAG: BCCT family transporter, partial [Candidatus Adiutrix sp.]|nr:BCCT family transporter [Candidatus Adiutrix sp.]